MDIKLLSFLVDEITYVLKKRCPFQDFTVFFCTEIYLVNNSHFPLIIDLNCEGKGRKY